MYCRNASSSKSERPTPTTANSSGSRLCRARFANPGASFRRVRSPDAPKMTSADGGAFRSSAARSACAPVMSCTSPARREQLASHVLAAVDGVDLAGDEGRVRVGEEFDDAGDLVGFAEAADGDLGDDLVEGFLGDGLDHFGGDVAGCDGVDGDALAGGLLADVAGLADDRA